MRAEAERHGLAFAHVPIVSGKATDADGDEMRRALDTMPGPILGFCRSGARSTTLWALANADRADPATLKRQASGAGHDIAALEPALQRRSKGRNMTYDVVIVGGGAAGIATASSILKRNSKVTIAIVDPAKDHYYQPGWTLVGAVSLPPSRPARTKPTSCPRASNGCACRRSASIPIATR